MNIWLVNTAERLSFDEESGRRMRMGLLGAHLAKRGVSVTYWTSTFNHVEKRKLSEDMVVETKEGQTIVRLNSLGYRRNLSLARVRDHRFVAREFLRQAIHFEKPDLVICSFPTIEMAHASTRYGKRNGIPVILDVRDLWPDLIHWSLPQGLRTVGKAATLPYDLVARQALRNANSLTAIADGFLEWALRKAGRGATDTDATISFTYEQLEYDRQAIDEARDYWDRIGVESNGRPIVIYIGSLIKSLDLRPVVQAARKLNRSSSSPLFVLCGAGDMAEVYRSEAAGVDNIVMPGWVNGAQIRVLLERATLAISPLPDRNDFRVTVNNKFVEYLSGGVPILVSPPHSHCAELVAHRGCGCGFDLGDSDDLARLVSSVIKDPSLLKIWQENARDLFKESFEEKKVMGSWDSLIEAVVRT